MTKFESWSAAGQNSRGWSGQYVPNMVPTADPILLLITPPLNESKLALSAQAHALVPEGSGEK